MPIRLRERISARTCQHKSDTPPTVLVADPTLQRPRVSGDARCAIFAGSSPVDLSMQYNGNYPGPLCPPHGGPDQENQCLTWRICMFHLDVVRLARFALTIVFMVVGSVASFAQVAQQAHLWISPGGGSCIRSETPVAFSAENACSTPAAAYAAANASPAESLILIRPGTYGPFQISGSRTSTNRITFDVEPGAVATFGNGTIQIGTSGTPSRAPRYVTIRNVRTRTFGEDGQTQWPVASRWGLSVLEGSQHIRLENVSAGGFLIRGSQHIELIGGDMGPCQLETRDGKFVFGACDINKVDHYPCGAYTCRAEHILIDGVEFHEFNYGAGCSGACHHRPMYINGVHNFTLRNSTFRDSVFEPWFTISGPAAAQYGNQNLLIENNQFGGPVQTVGHGLSLAWCKNANSGVHAYRNVTIRFNSFARGVNLAVPGSNTSWELDCRNENIQIYGNIFGEKHNGADGGNGCGNAASVTWRYNVFAGRFTGTCGATDVNIGGTTMPFYQHDTRAPSGDAFSLIGGIMAADNLVPESLGCPSDRRGTRRPTDIGFCDAGAFERHSGDGTNSTPPQVPQNLRILH
jgi:hypothetical protein